MTEESFYQRWNVLLEIVPAGLPHSADMLLDNTDRIKFIFLSRKRTCLIDQ